MNTELVNAFNDFEKAAIAYGKALGSTKVLEHRIKYLLLLQEAREKFDNLIQKEISK